MAGTFNVPVAVQVMVELVETRPESGNRIAYIKCGTLKYPYSGSTRWVSRLVRSSLSAALNIFPSPVKCEQERRKQKKICHERDDDRKANQQAECLIGRKP